MELTNSKRLLYTASYVSTKFTPEEQRMVELKPGGGYVKANVLRSLDLKPRDFDRLWTRINAEGAPQHRDELEKLFSIAQKLTVTERPMSTMELASTMAPLSYDAITHFVDLHSTVEDIANPVFIFFIDLSRKISPIGRIHLERIEMYPAGVQKGELVFTVPMAPGETVAWFQAILFGDFVKFIHQAVEWENLLYFLYPYFWGSETIGRDKMLFEHADPEHERFLRAGYARIVLPVRPGFEEDFTTLLETGSLAKHQTSPYQTIAQDIANFARTNYAGIPPANPELHARPLLFPEQRATWDTMQDVMKEIDAFKAKNGHYPAKLDDLPPRYLPLHPGRDCQSMRGGTRSYIGCRDWAQITISFRWAPTMRLEERVWTRIFRLPLGHRWWLPGSTTRPRAPSTSRSIRSRWTSLERRQCSEPTEAFR